MDTQRVREIVLECTVQLRKGEAVEVRESGWVQTTEVFAMPHESEAAAGLTKVDVHFMTIGVDPAKAAELRQELAKELETYPNSLCRGPSYIEVGAELGDQGMALSLFALGEVCGFWKVITPEQLGAEGDMAREMAGAGFVMCSGFSAG